MQYLGVEICWHQQAEPQIISTTMIYFCKGQIDESTVDYLLRTLDVWSRNDTGGNSKSDDQFFVNCGVRTVRRER